MVRNFLYRSEICNFQTVTYVAHLTDNMSEVTKVSLHLGLELDMSFPQLLCIGIQVEDIIWIDNLTRP